MNGFTEGGRRVLVVLLAGLTWMMASRVAAAQVPTRAPAPRIADVRPAGAPPLAVRVVPVDAFTVVVTWDLAPWTTTYAIERAPSAAGPWGTVWGRTSLPPRVTGIVTTTPTPAPAANPAGMRTSHLDTTALAPSTAYVYRVLAVYIDSAPGTSSILAVATPPLPAVRVLSTRFALEGKGVRLEWGAPVTPTSRLVAYRVYREGTLIATPSAPIVAGGPALPLAMYTDTTLASGMSANYAVDAVFRLNNGSDAAGPRANIVGRANGWIVRSWCPPTLLATVTYPSPTQAVVRAVDALTRVPLQGTVTLESAAPTAPSYALGTAFPLPPCSRVTTTTVGAVSRAAKNTTRIAEAPDTQAVACAGTVTVSGYSSAIVNFTPPAGTR